MDKIKIFDDLFMFTSYNESIKLSFNQFLILGEEPVLIHTGNYEMAEDLVPLLKETLGNKQLSYIFVSHFESDECGGLSLLLEYFRTAKTICSPVTARQLTGFGYNHELIVKSPEETINLKSSSFKFISYPSEMHLWEGILAFEEKKGLLFSSDLFIRMGKVNTSIVDSNLKQEVDKITLQQIPSPAALKALQEIVTTLPIKYIVPGHGPILKL